MAWYSRLFRSKAIEPKHEFPDPLFRSGQLVRSVVGYTGDTSVRTEIVGPVATRVWHWKRASWVYFLDVPGRRKRRWYLECALVPVDESQGQLDQALL